MRFVDPEMEADLRQAVRFATSYAQETSGVPSPKATTQELEVFYAKCHEGFSLSQDVVLKAILSLAPRIKELSQKQKELAKGKKQPQLRRDEVYQQLAHEIAQLNFEVNVYRRVADTMAWQILGMNRVLMRSTLTGHDHHGSILDQNIQSVVDAISALKKPGDFYLITDLTSCLGAGVGDLLHVDAKRQVGFTEVKSGADNARIFELFDRLAKRTVSPDKQPADHSDYCLYPYRDLFEDKKKRAHVGRVIRQMERTSAVLTYDKENIGEDITLNAKGKPSGRRRISYVLNTKDEHAFKEIAGLLDNASVEEPYFGSISYADFLSYLVSDNVKSPSFATSLSPFVRLMNARHIIFHTHADLECGWVKRDAAKSAAEFRVYSTFFVLDWVTQIVRDPTACPPFALGIKQDHVFDLLAGRKSLFAYFDREKFVTYANVVFGGDLIASFGKADKEFCGITIQSKNSKTGSRSKAKEGSMRVGWGPILRMMIEFQQPDNVVAQIAEHARQVYSSPKSSQTEDVLVKRE